jgi:hypothetical protein
MADGHLTSAPNPRNAICTHVVCKPLKKMRTIKTLILAIGFLGQSCSGTDAQFEKILRSPDEGQVIEITGTIHERFEDNAIYLTGNSSMDKAIWIEYSELFMLRNTFEGLDGQRIKVKGEFDKTGKGHLGQYAGTLRETIIIIDE